jgi:hypothetical protein
MTETNTNPDQEQVPTNPQQDTKIETENKWHVAIRALDKKPIQTKNLDNAIKKVCPNIVIIKSLKTKSQETIFYKFENPTASFNSLYKHRVALCQELRSTLSLEPWTKNPTHSNRMITEPKHVIVREVPTDYTEEEIRTRIDPGINKDIMSIGRIKSSKTGKPASIIRIICETQELANSLIRNGLLLGNRKLNAEAANPLFNPLRCYNCSRYGHHSSNCENEQCCDICGYNHKTSDCHNKNNRSEHYCINCQSTSHNSRDRNCPVHLEEVRKLPEKKGRETNGCLCKTT